jgi:hypothetical protein
MVGCSILPSGPTPHHMKDDANNLERTRLIDGLFNEVTVWGHDVAPSEKENAVVLCRDLVDLAKAIHS